jgi:hypothetical protein
MSFRPVEIELSHAKKWKDAHNEARRRFYQTSSPEIRVLPLVSVAKTGRLILLTEIIDDYPERRKFLT